MQQEPERILRIRTVLARSGLSRSTLYRKMEKGTFPKQVRISEYCAGWRESELNRWIADPPGWRPMPATAPKAHSPAEDDEFAMLLMV
jgi:prophage regulatory protein